MMLGGPRECLQQLIIRKNYGFTHMIVGKNHAGCDGFYGSYDALSFVNSLSVSFCYKIRIHINWHYFQEELGINIIPMKYMVYVPHLNDYYDMEEARLQQWNIVEQLSESEFKKAIRGDQEVPQWILFPQITKLLRESENNRNHEKKHKASNHSNTIEVSSKRQRIML
jgi:sulfate adenylyltransferase